MFHKAPCDWYHFVLQISEIHLKQTEVHYQTLSIRAVQVVKNKMRNLRMCIYNDEKHRVHEESSKVYVQAYLWVLWPVSRIYGNRFRHVTVLPTSPAEGILGHHTNDLAMDIILTMTKCPSWMFCRTLCLSFFWNNNTIYPHHTIYLTRKLMKSAQHS